MSKPFYTPSDGESQLADPPLIIFIHQKGRNTYEEKKYSAFNRIYTTLFTNIHGSRNKKNNRKKERKKPNLVNMRFIYTLRF